MIENVMHKMGGVGGFGIISICLFFAFFTGMLLWAVCLKKSYLNAMRQLPLDHETAPENTKELNPRHDHE
jgi:hypothetical protein